MNKSLTSLLKELFPQPSIKMLSFLLGMCLVIKLLIIE